MSDIKKKPGKKPGVKSALKQETEIEYDYQAIRTLIPYVYDWFASHHTTWPSQTCRWGSQIQDKTYKWKQRVYSSEQTDGSDPNRLLIVEAEVCKKRISGAENLRQWKEGKSCQYVKPYKSIVHPGEVNKVRELPQYPHVVVTHTDAPELYLWNTETQKDRSEDKGKNVTPSVADITLQGHKDNAQFALGISKQMPLIASGGQDKRVLIWDIQGNIDSVVKGGQQGQTLQARDILEGHKDTVEDVNFKPASADELVSVGDDKQILVWDLRTGKKPVLRVVQAHGQADLQCVDWDCHEGYNFATGCQNGALRIWDIRKLSSSESCEPVYQFKVHKGGLNRVEWSSTVPQLLASGGEDKQIYCWKLDRSQHEDENSILENTHPDLQAYQKSIPQQLLLHHAVHRGNIVDFQWHNQDPYTMLSLSDEADDTDLGGGTLQMWRIHDFVYRSVEECTKEIEDNLDYIVKGQHSSTPKRKKTESNLTPAKSSQDIIQQQQQSQQIQMQVSQSPSKTYKRRSQAQQHTHKQLQDQEKQIVQEDLKQDQIKDVSQNDVQEAKQEAISDAVIQDQDLKMYLNKTQVEDNIQANQSTDDKQIQVQSKQDDTQEEKIQDILPQVESNAGDQVLGQLKTQDIATDGIQLNEAVQKQQNGLNDVQNGNGAKQTQQIIETQQQKQQQDNQDVQQMDIQLNLSDGQTLQSKKENKNAHVTAPTKKQKIQGQPLLGQPEE